MSWPAFKTEAPGCVIARRFSCDSGGSKRHGGQTHNMHVLLSNKSLQAPFRKHTVRVVMSGVGAADSRVLVILDRIHRQSLDDLALVATLCLEPYSIDRGRT
jgi:hypothetical protein